jgi:hypothetical protein
MTPASEPLHRQDANPETGLSESIALEIRDSLRGLEYGQVRIEIQQGRVTLIERVERQRVLKRKT